MEYYFDINHVGSIFDMCDVFSNYRKSISSGKKKKKKNKRIELQVSLLKSFLPRETFSYFIHRDVVSG